MLTVTDVDRSRRGTAAAGVVVGVLACAALVRFGVLARTGPPEPRPDRRAELLAAIERSRHATFVVESDFLRRMDDGNELHGSRLEVQRPPDRLVLQFGGVQGRKAGRELICTTGPDEPYRCGPGPEAETTFDEDVAAEMAVLRTYFDGDRPVYSVTQDDDGCFALEQVAATVLPPTYGSGGRLCFDERTGAMSRLERRIANATETVSAVAIRVDVTEGDFDLSTQGPDDLTRDGVLVDGGLPSTSTTSPVAPGGSSPGTTAPVPPGSTGSTTTSSTTTSSTIPAGPPVDPCRGGSRSDGTPCSEDDLIAACGGATGARLAARQLWDRRLSVNDARLVGHPCGPMYVAELFSHGYRPT